MTRSLIKLLFITSTALATTPAFAQNATSDAVSKAKKERADEVTLEEIVVTAQKRTQVLTDVPQSVAVVGGAELDRELATGIADFARKVPGLAFLPQDSGQSMVVLRGIASGSVNPTVAVYVDDTPFGASTGQSNAGALAADFDTFDMQRIEVLRGPQGTLYGANSLGGVIRYISTPPKLDEFEGKVEGNLGTISDGSTDWSTSGMVNIPLGPKVALRTSGYYRARGGFINAPSRNAGDVNKSRSYGGRSSLLIKPSDTFSVRLTAILQNLRTESHSSYDGDPLTFEPVTADPFTDAPLSGLTRTENGVDKTNIDYRLYTGTIDWDLGFANLTSVTSYGRLVQDDNSDLSFLEAAPGVGLGDVITGLYGSASPLGVNYANQITMKKFTQEVRLASPNNDTFEWVVGAYYTREPGLIYQRYLPFDISSGAALPPAIAGFDQLVLAELDSTYREYAAFGSATWHLSSRFDITAGGRYSHNSQDTTTILDGVLFGGRTESVGHSSEDVFTWSVSPRYEINDHSAVYVRVAKGFRPGGPNAIPPGAGPDFPTSFKSDTLISYEIGLRGETDNRVFSWDTSLYYLDWSKIQINVVIDSDVGPINVDGNGKDARSLGLELTTTLRPVRGLTATTSFAYTDAKLTADTGNGGYDGDSLPITPKYTANIDLNYEWSVSDTARAFVGGNFRYMSSRVARFDEGYQLTFNRRPTLGAFSTVDLRAGVDFDRFSVSLYAKNLTNERGLANIGLLGERPGGAMSVYPIRPRTIGLTFSTEF